MTISGEYRAARALDYFHQGYNCSQSVFTAFADVCGLSEETALRLSSPLGAGIGRMREVCGAFCGLSMVAGSLHGNTSPDTGEKEKIFSLVQSLAADFKKEFGTLYCRELLGLTPEQLAGETARGRRPIMHPARVNAASPSAHTWRRIWKPALRHIKTPGPP